MDISFVIVTRNRFDKLNRLIWSLLKALESWPIKHEIIIIDDGSTDDTIRLESRNNLNVVHIDNAGPCVARNLGGYLAKSAHIAFLDDDAFLDSETPYLKTLYEHIKLGDFDLVGGPALSANVNTTIEKYFEEIGFLQQPCIDSKGDFACFPTVNVLMKKEAFLHIKGFDERFTFPGGEDNNLTIRLLKSGFKLYYDSNMYIYHDNNISLHEFIKRYFRYGRGNAINQKFLGLSEKDCRFELYDIKGISRIVSSIKESLGSFEKLSITYTILDFLRFFAYEFGGIYQKVIQHYE